MTAFERLQTWANSKSALWLLGIWSYAEAILWIVLPDYLLLMLGMVAPQRARQWFFVAIGASAAGSLTMLGLAAWDPPWLTPLLYRLPFTHPQMLNKLVALLDQHGLPVVLLQPYSGIPAKLWVYGGAILMDQPLIPFMLLLILGRAIRMAIIITIGKLLGEALPGFIARFWLPLWIVYTAVFFYGLSAASRTVS